MDNQASVFLIDDDEAVRHAVLKTLRDAGLRARAFASGDDFFAQLPQVENACIVTDMKMAEMDGAAVVQRLHDIGLSAWPVIVITGHADVPQAVQMMKSGVIDFIEKPFDPTRLIESIRGALAALQDRRTRQAGRKMLVRRRDALTDRERQVFEQLIIGGTNKEIAGDNNISIRTVEVHRANVMRKMEADSLAALVRIGLSLNEPE